MGVLDKLPLREKIKLEVPQDVIPVEGIAEVNDYLTKELYRKYDNLRNYADYDRFLNRDFARDWTVTKGIYSGTFPKRVASFLYRERQIKLTPEQQSEVGNIAKRHCTKSSIFIFDITDKFDWDAGDFGDAGSCYWSDRRGARRVLSHYNARAIRFYRPDKPEKGMARAWLAPLIPEAYFYDKSMSRLVFKKEDLEDMFVVFNGYGHETQRAARLLATHLGLSYSATGLSNYGGTGGTLWINHYSTPSGGHESSAAFLIGAVDHIGKVGAIDLRYNVDIANTVACDGTCGRRINTREVTEVGGHSYCRTCYEAMYFTCHRCHAGGLRTAAKQVVVGTQRGIHHETWCQRCADANAFACVNCQGSFSTAIKVTPEDNDDPWCRDCFVAHHQRCTECELWRENGQITPGVVCTHCREERHERLHAT